MGGEVVGVAPPREREVPVESRLANELWYEFHRSNVCSGALPNSAGIATGRGEVPSETLEAFCRGVGRTGMAPTTGVKRIWPALDVDRSSSSFQSEFRLSEEGPIE